MKSSKLLIVNQNWMGDVLFSTPSIRAIRRKFPDSYMASLVPPRCQAILANNPYLNEVITASDKLSFFSPGYFGLIHRLRQSAFDAAIFFHRSGTKIRLTALSGVKQRWGYAWPGRAGLLTQAVPLPGKELHKIDYFLNLLQGLGISSDGRTLDFFSKENALTELVELLRPHGLHLEDPYVVLHVGGNWDLKRWPTEHFTQWIRLFLKEVGWRVVLCGTLEEEKIVQQITFSFGHQVVSLCGKTSLDTLAVLLKNARLLLSNDSGPIHLAASQGTKILGLFGPTAPWLTGPVSASGLKILRKDVGCHIPCTFSSCNYRVCMEWLTPEEVFRESVAMI